MKSSLLAVLTLGLALTALTVRADDGVQTASYTTSTFSAGSTYVLKVKDEYLYLSHGGWYGTQAVAAEFALPFTISADSAGTILNVNYTTANSSSTYLYWTNTGSSYYVDSSTSYTWSLEATTGGYLLKDGNGYYMTLGTTVYNDYYTFYYLNGTTSSSEATVWELLSSGEYENSLSDMMDAQAATTASLANLSDITSVDALESAISSYTEYDIDVNNADMYTISSDTIAYWTAVNFAPGTSYSAIPYTTEYSTMLKLIIGVSNVPYLDAAGSGFVQELTDLSPGIYRVCVSAVFSPVAASTLLLGSSSVSDDALAEYCTAYLFAQSGSQTSVSKVEEYGGETITTSKTGYQSFLSSYLNTFYVYVGAGESLAIGEAMSGRTPSSCTVTTGWTVTYLANESASMSDPVFSIEDGACMTASDFGGTVTVSFPYAWTYNETNYPLSSIALLSSNVTLTASDGTTVATSSSITYDDANGQHTLTIVFDSSVLEQLESDQTYTITLPGGTVGWSGSDYTNDEASVSFTITEATPGTYYIRSGEEGAYQYLSRGGCWATQALMDDYGLPVRLAYDSDNKAYTFQFADNDLYLYLNSYIYTDGSSNILWGVEAVDGGYIFTNKNTDNYGYYIKLDSSDNSWKLDASEYTVFALEELSEHKSVLDAYKDTQAVKAAAAAGYSVNSKEELETLLADANSFTTTDLTSSLTNQQTDVTESFNDGYNSHVVTYDATSFTPYTFYTESLTLSPGLYRYSVQGFHRLRDNAVTDEMLGARGLVFLTAGEAQTQLLSPFDNAAEEAYSSTSDCYAVTVGDDAGKYIPNNTTSAAAAFAASAFSNDVYFYVGSKEEVTFTLANAHHYAWQWMSQWTCWEDITLTQYEPFVIPVSITSAGYATLYYGAYTLEVPDGVTAYTASVAQTKTGFTATLTEVPDNVIPAGTAVILKGDEGSYSFSVSSDTYDDISSNDLWGVDEEVTYSADSCHYYYHLSLNSRLEDNSVGFYWYSSDGHSITCTPHKAFITLPCNSDDSSDSEDSDTEAEAEAGIRIVFADATAIRQVEAEGQQAVRQGAYSLTGLKLDADQALPPGVYIIDGKKVLIK